MQIHLTPHTSHLTPASERGIALLIVVSMLTFVGIMGVAFAFSMYLETQATRQFVSTTQARYLAEGGVSHAWALLEEDTLGSRVDDPSESWGTMPAGREVDVDEDGTEDARWWPIEDAGGQSVGRYAFKISDEGGKANLNAAQADPSPFDLGAINLTTLFEQAKLANAAASAQAVEAYRYGADGKPGVALVDDDGDGAVDEAEEYQPLALRGDDQLLDALEDLVAIVGLEEEAVSRLSQVATVYSWDLNVSVGGQARVNVNTATAEELLAVLLAAGVEEPWQVAVNMADYMDPDLEMSRVTKSSQVLTLTNQGPLGSWQWVTDHYETDEPGGDALAWSVTVPTGTFQLLAKGVSGSPVGDMIVGGVFKPSVEAGESLGTFTLEAATPLSVTVTHQEPAGTTCAFLGLELVTEGVSGGGTVIRGVEAVRINEMMIEPTMELAVSSATFDMQGSDWGCPVGSTVCSCSGVGQARWSWTSEVLPAGRYYVRVFGSAAGQTVGEVRMSGTSQLLVHGQHHPDTVAIGSDGKFTMTVGKTASDGTYYLQRVVLSQQPDGEYVELINLSDQPIDVSGWLLEGDAAGGRQARLPTGAVIAAHGILVAAVDLDDESPGVGGNGLDARSAWEIPSQANAVQLEFPTGEPTPSDDWLKVTLPSGTPARLKLMTSEGGLVDEVAYPLPLPTTADFQSLEKGDPTVILDHDGDGLDEGWYPSLSLYTAGQANDNEGLTEVVDGASVVHVPSEEIAVRNRPLEGIGELAGVSSGQAWQSFATADLAKVVDRLTVDGLRLECEGRLISGDEAWEEKADGYYLHTNPAQAQVSGSWEWTDVPDGSYRLSLYGWPREQVAVRWQRHDGTRTDWSPALSTDAQGRVVIGQITIGSEGTPANTLTLDVQCASLSGICHVDNARLDPRLIRLGPVNVNTAPLEVLRALPGMTEPQLARLIARRPYGDQDEKGRGIGDLLLGDALGTTEEDKLEAFRQLGHLVTTRSDMFQILSLGQTMEDERPGASQRIQTVIQR